VIRTEKRASINAEGQPLFKPRVTRLQAVAWQARHGSQQRLYEAVTDYVRHGYNQAMAAKQRHIGFLMILMQRLVTSSTAAIRTTLEKRQALLRCAAAPGQPVREHQPGRVGRSRRPVPGGSGMQSSGWELEKSEVEMLLELARETEAAGTDAKAEALLELIYKLQQEGRRPGAEGADLHRVRADPSDAGRLPGKPWFLGGDAQRQHGSGSAHAGTTGVLQGCARADFDGCRW
jgi:hypothetical protein